MKVSYIVSTLSEIRHLLEKYFFHCDWPRTSSTSKLGESQCMLHDLANDENSYPSAERMYIRSFALLDRALHVFT